MHRFSLPTLAAIAFVFLLSACASETTAPQGEDRMRLSPIDFSDLPGWDADSLHEAIPAFQRSCAVLLKKPADAHMDAGTQLKDWQLACTALQASPPADDTAAREFFTRYFRPYRIAGRDGSDGLFTGYYEAELRGSPVATGAFQVPLYAKPDDLITVDLSLFRPEWKGHNIVGKVEKNKLIPYDERAVIAQGSLTNRAQPLLWVDDKVDAFFLEIQGSGRVHMTDGSIVRIGYDGSNGRAFVPIGRTLADRGDIARPVTMPSVRAWLAAHQDRAQEIMNENRSYVFFRRLDNSTGDNDGPIGAEGIALTPHRSMAVDPSFVSLGTPVWLDSSDGTGHRLQRLMIAQDTGGAIKGAVRGDFFWGYGKDAETQAGAMQSRGSYFLLLPKDATPHVGS